MKASITLILAILCSTSIALATTYTGTTGDCTWTLDTDEGTLVISGTGAMADYSSYKSVPWYSYRSYVETVTIEDGVASIGDYAFYECSSLTSITIGSGVTSIGSYAFYWCESLTSVTIGSGVTSIGDDAFLHCISLTSITIPDGVTSIGSGAFNYCYDLTSITVSEENTAYASVDGVLYTYDMTTLVYYPAGKTDTSFTIPDGVTSIGSRAFINCSSLTSITIPDGVTSIGEYAFYDCSELTSITIPDGVTSIGEYAFRSCSSLTSVTIGSGVTSIGNYAFYYCTSLTSITIPDGVTSIGSYAFYYCSNLTSVTSLATTPPTCSSSPFSSVTYEQATLYAASNMYKYTNYWKDFTTIEYTDDAQMYATTFIGQCGDDLIYTLDIENGSVVIEGTGDMYNYDNYSSYAPWTTYSDIIETFSLPSGMTSIGYYAFYNCSSLTSITIPDSVTYIGSGAFYNCSSLTSITIPDGATSIGNYVFYKCSSLTSITIPDGVTSIHSYTFDYCSSLTSITIPESVTSIGSYAFSGCTSLTSITIPEGVTSIGSYYTFRDCSSLTSITIPDGVTSIGEFVFEYCSSLTSVNIGSGVTSIGRFAFNNCTSLTSVTIPESVTSIGDYAFRNCTSLMSVTSLNNTPPDCGSNSFSSETYEQGTLYAASTDYATTDYWSNFYNIVYIGGGSCGDDMKWYYSEGELIIFGSGDMYDYSSADEVPWAEFASEITSVTIGSSVTSISNYAFYACTSITAVTSYNTSAPTVTENTFNSSTYSSATLSVTSTSYVLADYWKQFSTKTTVDASEEEDYSVYDIFTDDSNDDNTAVNIATTYTSAIRTAGSAIIITTEAAQTAQVYSLAGQLIVKQAVAAGETTIGMPTGGVYVVALADGTRAKVIVK